jgi:hypothetical protein
MSGDAPKMHSDDKLLAMTVLYVIGAMGQNAETATDVAKAVSDKLKELKASGHPLPPELEKACENLTAQETAKILEDARNKIKEINPQEMQKIAETLAGENPEMAALKDPNFVQNLVNAADAAIQKAKAAYVELGQECKAPAVKSLEVATPVETLKGYAQGVNGTAFTAVTPPTGPIEFKFEPDVVKNVFSSAANDEVFHLVDAKAPIVAFVAGLEQDTKLNQTSALKAG